jgi:hypothetical protein
MGVDGDGDGGVGVGGIWLGMGVAQHANQFETSLMVSFSAAPGLTFHLLICSAEDAKLDVGVTLTF